jgi:hypothetical protein
MKHEGAQDNKFLVTHPMSDLYERCFTFAIARMRSDSPATDHELLK